ncbi:MAG: InlB B-repeat-containing protein [Lachnospiraceae bacterium]|nr:InlB B-repeat-containing protein [Lachnospiraceae bacterium]
MEINKLISIAMAAFLSINSSGNTSLVLNDSIKSEMKTESTTKETDVVFHAKQVASSDYGLCNQAKDGAILHAWCWSFNTIKENLKDIAEAGYTTVQTCPANECLRGENGGMSLMSENGQGKWEYHYQPTDWKIGNYQLGTRDDFIEMCKEADKYGVKIIVDVAPNHTTPDLDSVSQSLKDAAGGQDKLYHGEGFHSISQWEQRYYCTNGAVLGLPDVNTENPGFQKYYLNYLNDLIACGVDGFRYDTAKHIGLPDDPQDEKTKQNGWKNNFWPVALGNQSVDGVSLHNKEDLFIYGEVLQSSGSRDGEYGKIFHLTGSAYGGTLRDAIRNKDFSIGRISNWNHATPDKIVTWVESHDTYCNNHESGFLTDWDIRMCWAIVAARANGTPLFYSRPAGSNGSQGNYWGNNKIGAKGNDQFKDPQVAACNHFRNAMVGESEYLSNFGGNDCLVIERGTKGVVVINLGDSKSNIKLNKVADGTYTEEISGKEVKVSGGVLNYEVPAGSIAVVYNASPVKKTPKVTVSKASCAFQEAFTLSLTASNATKASYTIDGGETITFTGKTTVKIGEDANVGDQITVKVTAEGEGENFSETFTYTMTEAPEYKMMLRVKKSDFDYAPTLYLYSGEGESAVKYNGAWPGMVMTADGDYYVYSSDNVESATAILVSGTWRSTQDMQPGLTVSGYMEYDKASNKFTTFTLPMKTKKPIKETENPATTVPTLKPTSTPTIKPTAKPIVTITPEPISNADLIYKITYELNGGVFASTEVKYIYHVNNEVKFVKPIKKGYSFKGWYTDQTFSEKINGIPNGMTGDITVYAKWAKVTKPSKTTIKTLKNVSSKKISVVLKSKVSGAVGYQIMIAKNTKFTSGKKTYTTKTLSKVISGLKKGTIYYVKVRAYKIDSTGNKIYGAYTAAKKVKIKK